MPKPRTAKLETPTARRKLAVRKKPYWTTISPGIHLGYRRNQTAGTWSVRVADGGAEWIKRIAIADDLEAASPPAVLNYWQAVDAARSLARRQPGEAIDESRPLTVNEALDHYEADLIARGGSPYNARHPRIHLPGVILNKPIALLGATELRKWRDSLLYPRGSRPAPSTGQRPACGRRLNSQRRKIRASETSEPGDAASPLCRTRTLPETWSAMTAPCATSSALHMITIARSGSWSKSRR
jgi:hypothetical protein